MKKVLAIIFLISIGIILGWNLAKWLDSSRDEVWRSIESEPICEVKVEPTYPYDPEVMDIWPDVEEATDVELEEEAFYDSLETLAILVQAEAGNQDLKGKQLVADVVLNRVDSKRFANSIEEVIFEPGQFSVMTNGRFDKAAKMNLDKSREAVQLEVFGERLNNDILFFNTSSGDFKYGDHYFSH